MKKISIDVKASGKEEMKKVRKYLRSEGYSVRERKTEIIVDINFLSNNYPENIIRAHDFEYYENVEGCETLTLPQDWNKLIEYTKKEETKPKTNPYFINVSEQTKEAIKKLSLSMYKLQVEKLKKDNKALEETLNKVEKENSTLNATNNTLLEIHKEYLEGDNSGIIKRLREKLNKAEAKLKEIKSIL